MNILIVDDEPLARSELTFLLNQCPEVNSVEQADSIEECFRQMNQQMPDVLFLDIHLSDENGLDLAKKINQVPNAPFIIFATAFDQHAIEAFNLNAVDYILKPFEFKRIQQAVTKAQETLTKTSALQVLNQQQTSQAAPSTEALKDLLPVSVEDKVFFVPIADIYYLEAQNKKLLIHTLDHIFETNDTLISLEKTLTSPNFLRIHRSYLVNLDYIKEMEPWFNQTMLLTMRNDEKIPVSRSYVKGFKHRLKLNR